MGPYRHVIVTWVAKNELSGTDHIRARVTFTLARIVGIWVVETAYAWLGNTVFKAEVLMSRSLVRKGIPTLLKNDNQTMFGCKRPLLINLHKQVVWFIC